MSTLRGLSIGLVVLFLTANGNGQAPTAATNSQNTAQVTSAAAMAPSPAAIESQKPGWATAKFRSTTC